MGTHPIFESDFDCLTEMSSKWIHTKCRKEFYARTVQKRATVPDNKVAWDSVYSDYSPLEYTADFVKNAAWADQKLPNEIMFNDVCSSVDRRSFEGEYKIDS